MTQLTVDIYLLHDHPDIRDLEQVLPASGGLEEAAGVRDGLLGVAHEGVLPVGEALVLAVPPATHVLALESVPLVPHPALRLIPGQFRDDFCVEKSDLNLNQQPEPGALRGLRRRHGGHFPDG